MNINRLHSTPTSFWDEVDNFFNSALAPTRLTSRPGRFQVQEGEDGWSLRTDLPGYRKDQVEVSLENGYLRVSATASDDSAGFVKPFEERLRISPKIDTTRISAHLEHGVLEVRLPRKQAEEPSNIRIDVN
jgi:HSP20 family protein